jgi:hypothetical protein
MARIDWAHLCELAFLDNCGRLCLVGVTTRFPVPSLPVAVHQLMIAARVVDVRPGEAIDLALWIATPGGRLAMATDAPGGDLEISLAGEYVLITLRQFPLVDEGIHRFGVSLSSTDPVTLEVPVLLVSTPSHAEIH